MPVRLRTRLTKGVNMSESHGFAGYEGSIDDDFDYLTGERKLSKLAKFKKAIVAVILRLLGVEKFLKEQSNKFEAQNNQLRNDMKILYQEVNQNVKYFGDKASKIKPVIKVDDPEAVAFMKGILSTHDKRIESQQLYLETKKLELDALEREVRAARSRLEQDIILQNEKNNLIMDKLLVVQKMLNELAAKDDQTTT
jgi:hypothetical protein